MNERLLVTVVAVALALAACRGAAIDSGEERSAPAPVYWADLEIRPLDHHGTRIAVRGWCFAGQGRYWLTEQPLRPNERLDPYYAIGLDFGSRQASCPEDQAQWAVGLFYDDVESVGTLALTAPLCDRPPFEPATPDAADGEGYGEPCPQWEDGP